VINALKNQQIDINKFNFKMRVELVKLVSKHSPADLQVFYKYINQNILSWRNVAEKEFENVVKLVAVFAEAGIID